MADKPIEKDRPSDRPSGRSGVYEEGAEGKLQEKHQREHQEKEAERYRKQREELTKELSESNKPGEKEKRIALADDTFENIGKKISEARDRFLKANEEANDTDSPNLEALRERRLLYYGEYRNISDELIRRVKLDLEK